MWDDRPPFRSSLFCSQWSRPLPRRPSKWRAKDRIGSGLSRIQGRAQRSRTTSPRPASFPIEDRAARRYIVVVLVRRCPRNPEYSAERYCLGRLSPHQAIRFKRHCAVCRGCAGVLARENEVVALMRAGGCGPSAAARVMRQVVDRVSLDGISSVGVDVVRIIWFYGSVSAVPPRRPSRPRDCFSARSRPCHLPCPGARGRRCSAGTAGPRC